jgi:hypothetical protein
MASVIGRIAQYLENLQDWLTRTQLCFALGAIGLIYVIKQSFKTPPFTLMRGPPSPLLLLGHWKALKMDKDAIKFCIGVTEEYGGVVKLKTFFGVSN